MKKLLLVILLLSCLSGYSQFINNSNGSSEWETFIFHDTVPATSARVGIRSGHIWKKQYNLNGNYSEAYSNYYDIGSDTIVFLNSAYETYLTNVYLTGLEMTRFDIEYDMYNANIATYNIDSVIWHGRIELYQNSSYWGFKDNTYTKYVEYKDSIIINSNSGSNGINFNKVSGDTIELIGLNYVREVNLNTTYATYLFYIGNRIKFPNYVMDLSGLREISTSGANRMYLYASVDTIKIPNLEYISGVVPYVYTPRIKYFDLGNSQFDEFSLLSAGSSSHPIKFSDTNWDMNYLNIVNAYIDTLDISDKTITELKVANSTSSYRYFLKYLKLPTTCDKVELHYPDIDSLDLTYMTNAGDFYGSSLGTTYIEFPDTMEKITINYTSGTIDLDSCISREYYFNSTGLTAALPDSVVSLLLYNHNISINNYPKADTLRGIGGKLSSAVDRFNINDYDTIVLELSKNITLRADTIDLTGINKFTRLSDNSAYSNIVAYNPQKYIFPDTVWTDVGISIYEGTNIDTLDLSTFMNLNRCQIGGSATINVKKVVLPDSTLVPDGMAFRTYTSWDTIDMKKNRLYSYSFYNVFDSLYSPNVHYVPLDSLYSGNYLTYFEFNNTEIDSIDLKGFPLVEDCRASYVDSLEYMRLDPRMKLSWLRMTGSQIGYIDIFVNDADSITHRHDTRINLDAMYLTAAEVNQYLYDLDQIAIAGYNNRKIYLNGAGNAAPDATSGGYDGTAAKNSLVSKGFTVYTN